MVNRFFPSAPPPIPPPPPIGSFPVVAQPIITSKPSSGSFIDRVMEDAVNSTVGAAAGIGHLFGGLVDDTLRGDYSDTGANLSMMKQGFTDTSPVWSLFTGHPVEAAERWWQYPVSGSLDLLGAGSLAHRAGRRGAISMAQGGDATFLPYFGYKQLHPDWVSPDPLNPTPFQILRTPSTDPIPLVGGESALAGEFQGSRMVPARDILDLGPNGTWAKRTMRANFWDSGKLKEFDEPGELSGISPREVSQSPLDDSPVFSERAAIEPLALMGDKVYSILSRYAGLRAPIQGFNAKVAKRLVNDAGSTRQRFNHSNGILLSASDDLFKEWQRDPDLIPDIPQGISRDSFQDALSKSNAAGSVLVARSLGLNNDAADAYFDYADALHRPQHVRPGSVEVDPEFPVDRAGAEGRLAYIYANSHGLPKADAQANAKKIYDIIYGDKDVLSWQEYADAFDKHGEEIGRAAFPSGFARKDQARRAADRDAITWNIQYPSSVQSKLRQSRLGDAGRAARNMRLEADEFDKSIRRNAPGMSLHFNPGSGRTYNSGYSSRFKDFRQWADPDATDVNNVEIIADGALSRHAARIRDSVDSPFDAVHQLYRIRAGTDFVRKNSSGKYYNVHPNYYRGRMFDAGDGPRDVTPTGVSRQDVLFDAFIAQSALDKVGKFVRDSMDDARVRELVVRDKKFGALWELFDKYSEGGQKKFNPLLAEQLVQLADRVLWAANKVDPKKLTDEGRIPGLKKSDIQDIDYRKYAARDYHRELRDLGLDADTIVDELVFAFPESKLANDLWARRLMRSYGGLTPREVGAKLDGYSKSIEREARHLSRAWNQALKEADHFPEQVHFGIGSRLVKGEGGRWHVAFSGKPDVVERSPDNPARTPYHRIQDIKGGLILGRRLWDNPVWQRYVDSVRAMSAENSDVAHRSRSDMSLSDLNQGAARQHRWWMGILPTSLREIDDVVPEVLDEVNKRTGIQINRDDMFFVPMRYLTEKTDKILQEANLRNPDIAVGPHGIGEAQMGDPFDVFSTGNWDASAKSQVANYFYNSNLFMDRQFQDIVKDVGYEMSWDKFQKFQKDVGEDIPMATDKRSGSGKSMFVAVDSDGGVLFESEILKLNARRALFHDDKILEDSVLRRDVERFSEDVAWADDLLKQRDAEYWGEEKIRRLALEHGGGRGKKVRVVHRTLYERLLWEASVSNNMALAVLRDTGKAGKQLMLHFRPLGWIRNNAAGSLGSLLMAHPKHAKHLAELIPMSGKYNKVLKDELRAAGVRVTETGTGSFASPGEVLFGGLESGVGVRGAIGRYVQFVSRLNTLIADEPFRLARLHGAIKELGDDLVRRNGGKMPEGVRSQEDLWQLVAKDPDLRAYAVERTLGDMINFSDMTRGERHILGSFITFYPWLKGSWKLAHRVATDKPELLALMSNLSEFGIEKFEEEYGEYIPEYLKGAMLAPKMLRELVGVEDLLVNPSGINPLETPADLGVMGVQSVPLPRQMGGASYRRFGSENVLNSLHPLMRVGVAGFTGRDIFMGTPKPRDEGAGWGMAKDLYAMIPPLRPLNQFLPGANHSPAKITPESWGWGYTRFGGVPLQPVNPGMMWQRGFEEARERHPVG